ncbi:MAG: hypothetical protein L3J96_01655 [Thermoplasmata archaeon]|nr:hypothetical protein [Thermoplasmata archaeon]
MSASHCRLVIEIGNAEISANGTGGAIRSLGFSGVTALGGGGGGDGFAAMTATAAAGVSTGRRSSIETLDATGPTSSTGRLPDCAELNSDQR